jgi:hypothetical protein
MERPQNWIEWINEPDKASELDDLRSSAQRGRAFGSEDWMINIAKKPQWNPFSESHRFHIRSERNSSMARFTSAGRSANGK